MHSITGTRGILAGRGRAKTSPTQPHSCPSCGRNWNALQHQGCHLTHVNLKARVGIRKQQNQLPLKQVRCMCTGSGFDGEPENEPEWLSRLQTPLAAAASGTGITGTIAIILGYLLHVDPLGHMQFSILDVEVGLGCFVPSFFFHLGVLVSLSNDLEPQTYMKIDGSGDRQIVTEVRKDKKDRTRSHSPFSKLSSQWDLFQTGVKAYAVTKSVKGGRDSIASVSPLLLIPVVFISVLAQEMLLRGVGLTWLSMWFSDRLSEGGVEDICYANGCSILSIANWSAVFVLSCGKLGMLGLKNDRTNKRRSEMREMLEEQLGEFEGAQNQMPDNASLAKRVDMIVDTSVVMNYVSSLEVLLDGTASSTAFVLTGNLWAAVVPYTISSLMASAVSWSAVNMKANIDDRLELKVQTLAKLQEMKIKLLKVAVKDYLGKKDDVVSEEGLKTPDKLEGSQSTSKEPEGSDGAEISVSGKILVMMLRQEMAQLNASIKSEKPLSLEGEPTNELNTLKELRVEIEGLLSDVEKHLEENPETDTEPFQGQVAFKAQNKVKSKDDDQPSK